MCCIAADAKILFHLFLVTIMTLTCLEPNPAEGQQGIQTIVRHPNHNYYPNGTMVKQVIHPNLGDIWKFIPSMAQTKDEKRTEELYKLSEWGNTNFGHPPPPPSGHELSHQPSESMPPSNVDYEKRPAPPLPPPAPHQHKPLHHEESGGKEHHHHDHPQEDEGGPIGTLKAPECAEFGRYYCSYKEEYPSEVVTQVTKYLKWPLEKLFRDLRDIKLPKLAETGHGALVCDSLTRIIRPGWAKTTNGRWLVVINTEHYHQYVTEVVCKYDGAYCNFIPPCYHATCQQRYNTQTLLVVDPYNPYKGPFLSQFLFPSCCICHVPSSPGKP